QIFAKAQRDWAQNVAREHPNNEEVVVINSVRHTIDVRGREKNAFLIIIDLHSQAEVWVFAGPRKVEIQVPTRNAYGGEILVGAGEKVQTMTRAILAIWEK
ncbi:MAG: hypothetical protein AAB857_01125, partial [Patescibacteria group bacterium]